MTVRSHVNILNKTAQKDRDDAVEKSQKKDFVYGDFSTSSTLAAPAEEAQVGHMSELDATAASLESQASDDVSHAIAHINT